MASSEFRNPVYTFSAETHLRNYRKLLFRKGPILVELVGKNPRISSRQAGV
jgi:hypothetical protein